MTQSPARGLPRASTSSAASAGPRANEIASSWDGGGYPLLAEGFRRLLAARDDPHRDSGGTQLPGLAGRLGEVALDALVEQVGPRLALARPPQLAFLLYLPNLGRLRVTADRREKAGWSLALAAESEGASRFLGRHAEACAARLADDLGEPVSLCIEQELLA